MGLEEINVPCAAYDTMAELWELIDDLMGGTLAMRDAGRKWLPAEPKEKDDAYNTRLERSILYGIYRDTIKRLAAKPFSKPVQVKGELPERLSYIEDNADRMGTSLSRLARAVFVDAIKYGLSHILVDFPAQPGINLADERQRKIYPYFTHISAKNLIGWKTRRTDDGRTKLSEIRIREYREEAAGSWGTRKVLHVRRWTEKYWELYRLDPDSNEWQFVTGNFHTFNALRTGDNVAFDENGLPLGEGGIPLFTFYTNQTGILTAEPPLEDLGWINLAHWQSMSDQRNILRIARVGILFMKGVTPEEKEKETVIGPNKILKSENPEADLKHVEHSGSAAAVGRQDLLDLEYRGEVLGVLPLLSRRSTEQTATGQKIDESSNVADIQAWIRNEETMFESCYEAAAIWTGDEIQEPDPNDNDAQPFAIDIFSEFSVALHRIEDANVIIKCRQGQRPIISHVTAIDELKRRGNLSEDVDPQREIDRIGEEGPSLSNMFPPDDDDDDEEIEEEEREDERRAQIEEEARAEIAEGVA